MAISPFTKRATLAAVRELEAGNNLTAATRSFWSKYNFPAMDVRNDIIGRANAVILGREEFDRLTPSQELRDIYLGTGYCPDTEDCGPFDTAEATLFYTAKYKDNRGKTVYRSIRTKAGWDTIKSDLDALVQSEIKGMRSKYGLRGGVLESGITLL